MTDAAARFYDLRDGRLRSLGASTAALTEPVGVAVGHDAAETRVGQIITLGLVNLLARAHRRLVLVVPDVPRIAGTLVEHPSLLETVEQTARAINPFIDIRVETAFPRDIVSVSVGATSGVPTRYYAGAKGAIAFLATRPLVIDDRPSSLLGGSFAACLAAAACFRSVHGDRFRDRAVSIWNFREGDLADPGPWELGPLDIGSVGLLGAGAVAGALAYWLHDRGVEGEWRIVDRDLAELHNTSRAMHLTAAHAGWPDGKAAYKADPAATLIGATPVRLWHDEWFGGAEYERPDLVIPAANERGVRHDVALLGYEVVVHAATSRNWTAELHRHIADVDDCLRCRYPSRVERVFACAEGPARPGAEGEAADAALPFLSGAAGALLMAGLSQLEARALGVLETNHHVFRFDAAGPMVRSFRRQCREECSGGLKREVRTQLNADSRWAEL